MGHKKACLHCRKSYNIDNKAEYYNESLRTDAYTCPECNEPAIVLNQKFKPPKRDDNKKWDVVQFLYENGFTYYSIYDGPYEHGCSVPYPETMAEAVIFVEKYKRK